ncbi:MAG: PH domain-containing protein [bacterium]|nr:PH domain-containing protein [bacterium]
METVEFGRYYQLGPKTYWFLIIKRLFASLMLLVLAPVFYGIKGNEFLLNYSQFFDIIAIFLLIASFLLFIASIIIALLEYKTSRVMMDDSTFHIVRGILSKEEVSIPYRRVQSVEIRQPLIFRIFGLGRVVISTTTDFDQSNSGNKGDDNDEVINTMDYSIARMLENKLTNRAEVERIEIHDK